MNEKRCEERRAVEIPTLDLAASPDLKALTIRAPWAWAIAQGWKRVENRSWSTRFRGRIAIHAAVSKESDGDAAATFANLEIEPPSEFVRGAIIGTVELVDVLPLDEFLRRFGGDRYDRGFALGPLCWVLREPRLCVPTPCSGNFQLWNVARRLELDRERAEGRKSVERRKSSTNGR
ncbi:MAG: ASCH domain-containing protein [Thermoguttaceae bacterium]|nr:ASCH domain-containing protein [Thermoguttaceae bacterium]